jgi:N-acetylglucosamine-6-sulfatase
VPPGWTDWQALVDPSTYDVCNFTINHNRTLVPYASEWPQECRGDRYQTNVLAARARQFIDETFTNHPGQPLFLTVTPMSPHVELRTMTQLTYPGAWRYWIRWNPDDETNKPLRWNFIFRDLPLLPRWKAAFNEVEVTDKPVRLQRPRMTVGDIEWLTWQYRTRFAAMLSVDDLVGTVAAALGDQLANTVFIFTADNGFLHGEHRMVEKVVPYEESIRVPLYVAGPGIPGPRTIDDVVLNNDLAPTIAELAGTAPEISVDGRSLVPLLTGSTPTEWRTRFLIEHWTFGPLSDFPPPPPAIDLDVPTYAALRTGPGDAPYPNRLYVEHFDDPSAPGQVTAVELYDLTLDPDQLQSRHADPARAFERAVLHEQLIRLRSCGTPGAPECQSLER